MCGLRQHIELIEHQAARLEVPRVPARLVASLQRQYATTRPRARVPDLERVPHGNRAEKPTDKSTSSTSGQRSMLRTRGRSTPPPLPPGLEVYRPPELLGSSVLVVEDEPPMQAQLRLDLIDLGYQIRVAASAEKAKEILSQERVAGVLLDLVLDEGEEDGLELLRWIRQNHPGLAVVVLSAAQGSAASIRRVYEMGASSFFVKGSNAMAHIYSDLAARLIEGGTGRAGNYRFGRLDFDPTHRAMSLGNKQIRLTSQQTSLVIHLAQGSKPVTAGELIAAGLFRPNAARSTVHSAVLTLRRKLDELEPELGGKLLPSTPRGYSIGPLNATPAAAAVQRSAERAV